MRVAFFHSEKPRERLLADAFIRGLAGCGDSGTMIPLDGTPQVADGYEVAVMVGVKSIDLYRANVAAGVHVIMIDKGYTRHKIGGAVRIWEYWRVAVDAHHPTRLLMREDKPKKRAKAFRLMLQPWHSSGDEHVLIAGSSAKYHRFYGLPDPTEYACALVNAIKQASAREIVYRPKPSWKDAKKIKGTTFSGDKEPLSKVLNRCHALVTHGSNACFEAVLAGVPCVILGDGVALPISTPNLSKIESPILAKMPDRRRWLANLMYFQWTLHEFENGKAWATIRPQIYG